MNKNIRNGLTILIAVLMICTSCAKDNSEDTSDIATDVVVGENITDEANGGSIEFPVLDVVDSVKAVEAQMYFPADMKFTDTDYLYESSPKKGYYITVGALVSGKSVNSAYLYIKDNDKTLEFELPTDGVCKGVVGWTALSYELEANGIYFTFDNKGSATMWTLTKSDGEWLMSGTKITPPNGYHAAYAVEGAKNCGNWFVVLKNNDGGSDFALGTFDYGKTLNCVDLSAQIDAHGEVSILNISTSANLEYIVEAEFADSSKLNLVGKVDKNGLELSEKEWNDDGKTAPTMFVDAATIPQILG